MVKFFGVDTDLHVKFSPKTLISIKAKLAFKTKALNH